MIIFKNKGIAKKSRSAFRGCAGKPDGNHVWRHLPLFSGTKGGSKVHQWKSQRPTPEIAIGPTP